MYGVRARRRVQTVQAREHQVEDHQVVAVPLGLAQARQTVARHLHRVTEVAEVELDQAGDVLVVFDDEDRVVHTPLRRLPS